MKLATIWNWLTGAGEADPWHGMLGFGGAPTATGVKVDESSALNYSAVWAATRILSENIASLPLILYRRLPKGGKDRDALNPLYRVLHDQPNSKMDSFSFWECSSAHLLNWGNAYAEQERDGAGRVIGLWPIHPSRVYVEQLSSTNIYHVHSSDGRSVPVPASRMLHFTGPLSEDGVIGKGVIQQARESIGLGIATERYGASFFGKGAKPQGVLKHPKALSELAVKNMRVSWAATQGGPENFGMPLILEQGTEWVPISIPPEDAQFLQTRQHNITEIARWYRIPPHMLADLSRATFSNVEQQSLDFVIQSLRPWLVRIEKAIQRQLIGDESNLAEFLVDGLLRGDSVTRTQSLTQRWLNGNICQDEWRAIENLNPLPDGKGQIYFVPMNLTTIERMIEGPQEQAPPKSPAKETPADADEAPEPAGLAALAFNEDQPRDENGRWGSGGGGGKSTKDNSKKWHEVPKSEAAAALVKEIDDSPALAAKLDAMKAAYDAAPKEDKEAQQLAVDRFKAHSAELAQAASDFGYSAEHVREQEAGIQQRYVSELRQAGRTKENAALAALGLGSKAAGSTTSEGKLPETELAAADDFIRNSLATDGDFNIGFLPVDDFPKLGGRASYLSGQYRIAVPKNGHTETIVHELGHAIEEQVPGVNAASQAFLESRVGDQEPVSMAKTFPRSGFARGEKGRNRGFENSFRRDSDKEASSSAYYAGKDYGGSGSEVLSMGIEELYRDPVGFATRDPQYAKFVIGQLDGSLRAPQ